jgi:large subunit ribosomal protein L3
MPKRTRPRRGSLEYWPRKRARRIYPRQHFQLSKELKPLGFAAWKAGMTHVQLVDNNAQSPTYGKTITKAATILDAPPLLICGMRFYKKTDKGLVTAGEKWMEKLPENLFKRVNKQKGSDSKDFIDVRLIVSTQPEKSGMKKKKPDVFEISVGGDDAKKKAEYCNSLLGKEIAAKDIFKPGEFVDISAVTKGHGFTGAVKRFGIRIQRRKDQQHHRHVGSIGSTTPGKISWRVPQSGQYGFFTRTELNKKILMIGDDPKKVNPKGGFLGYGPVNSFITIEGSVTGPSKRMIRLRKASRKKKTEPVEIKVMSLKSKQGG